MGGRTESGHDGVIGWLWRRSLGNREDIYIVDLAASGFTSASGIVAGFPQYDHRNSDLPTIDMLVLFFELFWNGDPVDGADRSGRSMARRSMARRLVGPLAMN